MWRKPLAYGQATATRIFRGDAVRLTAANHRESISCGPTGYEPGEDHRHDKQAGEWRSHVSHDPAPVTSTRRTDRGDREAGIARKARRGGAADAYGLAHSSAVEPCVHASGARVSFPGRPSGNVANDSRSLIGRLHDDTRAHSLARASDSAIRLLRFTHGGR